MSGPTILDHLGPFTAHSPVQALILLTQRTWEQFHSLAGGHERVIKTQREYFVTRMMNISEIMSLGIRSNASWGLVHAAMSLLRDRYEQTVRFSWLARQQDGAEHDKYLLHFYSKVRLLMRCSSVRAAYERDFGPLPTWVTEKVTKEQRDKMRQWENLDLRTMATKRDALQPLTEMPIGNEKLEPSYETIYAQFSSVSHFDRYSLELIRIRETASGQLTMDTEPYWPGLLVLKNCYFDIIQCFEATRTYYEIDTAQSFNTLLIEWYEHSDQFTKKIRPT
jgi:hypothetical protein